MRYLSREFAFIFAIIRNFFQFFYVLLLQKGGGWPTHPYHPKSAPVQGCHGQGKVRENEILFKVREKSGSLVSGQGVPKSQFEVSEKSGNFILRLPQIILLDVLV